MATVGGGGNNVSSNDSYTINVYANDNMDERAVAQMVMERIQQATRDARERM
jgi:hypothetical protein